MPPRVDPACSGVGGAYPPPRESIAIFPGHIESSNPPKLTATQLSRGQRGWREYRRTGGVQRYARDRWWIKDGKDKWRKKARHRKDLPSMTEDEYEQWKAKRATARAKKRERAARGVFGVRQVALGKPGRLGSVEPGFRLTGDRHP